MRKPQEGRCHQKGAGLQQRQVVHGAKRPSHWASEYGVEGKGLEERSLDLGKQSFIADFG